MLCGTGVAKQSPSFPVLGPQIAAVQALSTNVFNLTDQKQTVYVSDVTTFQVLLDEDVFTPGLFE